MRERGARKKAALEEVDRQMEEWKSQSTNGNRDARARLNERKRALRTERQREHHAKKRRDRQPLRRERVAAWARIGRAAVLDVGEAPSLARLRERGFAPVHASTPNHCGNDNQDDVLEIDVDDVIDDLENINGANTRPTAAIRPRVEEIIELR